MAFSEVRGLVDPFGGREDIEGGIIRAVGDPEKRFSEDALRIMRAFRFSAVLGYKIDEKTLLAASSEREGLAQIARERIATEFLKLISADSCSAVLRSMIERKITDYVFGDYVPSDEVLCALDRCAPILRARLGILMSEATEEVRQRILWGLKLPKSLISDSSGIASRISEKLHGGEIEARRFIGGCGDLALDVLEAASALGRADADFVELVKKNINTRSCASVAQLDINGYDLIKLSFKGKEVGEILNGLVEAVMTEPSLNTKEKLEDIARGMKVNNSQKG